MIINRKQQQVSKVIFQHSTGCYNSLKYAFYFEYNNGKNTEQKIPFAMLSFDLRYTSVKVVHVTLDLM